MSAQFSRNGTVGEWHSAQSFEVVAVGWMLVALVLDLGFVFAVVMQAVPGRGMLKPML